jgi:chromosome partitioning protein
LFTIVLASRKGGAGKTTLALHLAVEAERQGVGTVCMIDADPMEGGGASSWRNRRDADRSPHFLRIGPEGIAATLKKAEQAGVDLVVIDTPPAATGALEAIFRLADLIVMPVVPSPNDLAAIGGTLGLIVSAERPVMFVLSIAKPRTILTKQAMTALQRFGPDASLAETIIQIREEYRSALIRGDTAQELKPAA